MRQANGRGALAAAALALVVLLLPEPAEAQLTTATLRGRVTDDAGAALAGVTVTATNTESGVSRADVSGGDGYYTLGGLAPGSYSVQVASANYAAQSRTVRVLVGQTLDADFQLATQVVATENVVVVGDLFVETKTSEVTTHVTEEQIDNLPQSNRNFLNFAALAPGVRTKTNEFDERQEVASGALGASEINVFIDGVSFKSDVLQGGVIGQDASRGNPFPQNAVQEYEVLTNNYKAEYETAASAIISAVTKSGSNALHGDVFGFYQDKDLVDEDEFVEMRRENDSRCPGGPAQICDEAEYERWQYGLAIGGPIVPDRAHFFLSFEGNRQDRSKTVFLGGNRGFFGGNLPARITEAEGNFTQPFRSDLYYGKVSFQAAPAHSLEFSGNIRHETDLRGFGEQIGIEAAENVKIDTGAAILKHQWVASSWMNQATLSYNHLKWNPTPENIGTVGEEFEGLIVLGGRNSEQDFIQDKFSLRNDLSYFLGSHSLKGGFVLNFAHYEASKLFEVNPRFFYRSDISSTFPYRARWGSGDPNLDADNTQLGLYIQDDWAATPRLTLNL
ncbi:MAG TPA: carboxypeptidase regulatory-like domain-containing protein, partial [Thermoanaerobaculia bacterium]|nr:carboxypeptidase regulatory-like domain-containing protein [Thermoanaerobaculia bacterium]